MESDQVSPTLLQGYCDDFEKKVRFISVTGAHGRFVPVSEGGVAREARTQTLEPDIWIREVRQRGHGTRRRIKLGRLEL